jgi:hypothetical protein
VVALDGAMELAHPGSLAVLLAPDGDGVGEDVELHAPVMLAGPHVRQGPTQLGVP